MTRKTIIVSILAIVFAVPAIYAAGEIKAPVPGSRVPRASRPATRSSSPVLRSSRPKTPDFTVPKLNVETSEELCVDFVEKGTVRVPGITYIARLNIDAGVRLNSSNGWTTQDGRIRKTWLFLSGYGNKILSTPTGMKLSSPQKELIAKGYDIVLLRSNSGISPIYALGVDKEQAKNTAIAFLEYLTDTAEKNYRSTEQYLPKLQENFDKASKEGEPYPDKIKVAQENFEQKQRETHYQHQTAALSAIDRMNQIVETQIIELCVLQARVKVIEKELAKEYAIKHAADPTKYERQSIIISLEKNRISVSIDLAEVDAKLQAADKIRTDADLYIQYQNKLSSINRSYSSANKRINNAHHELTQLENRIANPPKNYLPPKVIDNKITLEPVTIKAEPKCRATTEKKK